MHNGNGLREGEPEVDRLTSTLRDDLHHFVDHVRNGTDVRDHRIFLTLAEVLSSLRSHELLWLAQIFAPSSRDYESDFLYDHSINVSILAMAMGHELEIGGQDLLILGAGGLLHDVGMFDLPREIVHMQRPLTERERKIVETHPEIGFRILSESGLRAVFSRIALHEQERQNGTGYPHGLHGDEIEYFAKIVGFCDTIESLTHYRPYRKPKSFLDGFSLLVKDSREHFPKRVLMAALRTVTPYPPGSLVRLSTGRMARVRSPNPDTPMNPVVELLEDGPDGPTGEILDLRLHPMITIKDASVAGHEGPSHRMA
ncbi:MAG: HD domain-containing protein [Nitrospirae bacterium]|nr:HD domain-containing protein [Nitrospirota bacterium]